MRGQNNVAAREAELDKETERPVALEVQAASPQLSVLLWNPLRSLWLKDTGMHDSQQKKVIGRGWLVCEQWGL